MPIRNRFAEMLPEIAGWRQEFHRHPELMYDLPWTTNRVTEILKEIGVDEIVTGIGRSGIVAVIKGRPGSRTIGLRADMDALPIHEATGLEYASETPGQMHACGHDGHTSILLGTAKYLAESRNFDGTVVCIFQPAEEGGAGALAMINDGLMDRFGIDEVYGLHNAPELPLGEIATRPGPLQASADQFKIIVQGKGGHAAEPHRNVDTTLTAAQILVTLQTVVSRSIDPLHSVVVSVGTFVTDSNAHNVIADKVEMTGTVRTLDGAMRDLAEERIKTVVKSTAEAFGASAEVIYERGYPVTVNSAEHAEYAAQAAEQVIGRVERNVAPIMPAEDFSYMLEARPGAYVFLGNGASASCHHPAYNFNDDAIPVGCSYFVTLVENRLSAKE